MGMLSAHTPAARLPKRTEVLGMVGSRLIALETVGEDRFLRTTTKPLPEYGASVGIIVLIVGQPLTGKDVGNMDVGRGEYGGR